MWSSGPSTHEVADKKEAELATKISHAKEIIAQRPKAADHERRQLAFLKAPADQIARNIEEQKDGWTAEAVLLAYMARAIEAHEATNCLSEVMFEQALEIARAQDAEFAQTKRIVGPFHGVPVSFKDQYEVTGVDAAIGFTRWAFDPCKADARLVRQIRTEGGIPFVKTNVPQTMLSFECANPLLGRTTNPWNDKYTSGGSSGGEAALLACGGSALGFGSDVGGSLRIPAHFSGIFALKCGLPRFSKDGARSPNPGFEALKTVMGPMARTVGDLKLVCKTFFGNPGAPGEALAPVRWRDVEMPNKLKIGYYTFDGYVETSPACKRAVVEAVEAMKAKGHECVEFDPPHAVDAMEIFTALTSADGYKELLSHLGPDPKEKSLFLVTLGSKLPSFVRGFAKWIVDTFIGDSTFTRLLSVSKIKSVREFITWTDKRDKLQKAFTQEVWDVHHFDVIIAPVLVLPALPHGASLTLSPLASGTIFYNILELPVGVVPVTRVQPSDVWPTPAKGELVRGSSIFLRDTRKAYDPERMHGLPVGVQVVGPGWHEEEVLDVMDTLDQALGPRGFEPGTWSTTWRPEVAEGTVH